MSDVVMDGVVDSLSWSTLAQSVQVGHWVVPTIRLTYHQIDGMDEPSRALLLMEDEAGRIDLEVWMVGPDYEVPRGA